MNFYLKDYMEKNHDSMLLVMTPGPDTMVHGDIVSAKT